MRALLLAITCFAVLTSALPSHADSAIIAKPSLWRLIAEENQVAVINLSDNGLIDVRLFISIVDNSGKSNIIHLVLPFRDKPLSLRVEELSLADFRNLNTKALEAREQEIRLTVSKAQATIENDFRLTLAFSFPVGFLFWRSPQTAIKMLPPGVTTSPLGVQTLIPELTVTTEHTRTEVYKVKRAEDIDELLSVVKLTREQLDRLKRQLVGRYLYLVTARTVPLKSTLDPPSQTPQRQSTQIPESQRLGVVFYVRLKASVNGKALTFTYPLGTGETWGNPISLTELFITAPPNGSLQIRYPQIATETNRSHPTPYIRTQQQTFWGRDEYGHVARLTYFKVNPSEDVVLIFDPTKPPSVVSKRDAERIARLSILPFVALLVVLWFPMVWLFQVRVAKQTLPVSSFLWKATVIGILWTLVNAAATFIGTAGQRSGHYPVFPFIPQWRLTEIKMLAFALFLLAIATLFVIAFLPSMKAHRDKLLGVTFVTLCTFMVAFVVFSLGLVVLVTMAGPFLSSLVLWFWLQEEGERKLTYLHCLSFSLAFGILTTTVLALVRGTLLVIVSV